MSRPDTTAAAAPVFHDHVVVATITRNLRLVARSNASRRGWVTRKKMAAARKAAAEALL